VTTVVVEASEAWPVVAAGLGSALIVSWITLIVARKQRAADAKRLREQLAHDRTMREQELREASERLEQQLAQDRDMRDLQHLRQTLTPIVARVLDWDAFTSLHQRLKAESTRPIDDETWTTFIVPLVAEVADVSEHLRRDARTLVILAGPTAPVAVQLKEVASDGDALVYVTRQRAEGGRTTPEIQAALDGTWIKYGYDHARFVEAANETVRWGESGPTS
jgi:hypothetical protein